MALSLGDHTQRGSGPVIVVALPSGGVLFEDAGGRISPFDPMTRTKVAPMTPSIDAISTASLPYKITPSGLGAPRWPVSMAKIARANGTHLRHDIK